MFPHEKKQLHPRNKHLSGYDFDSLCKSSPELIEFVFSNSYGNKTIDFSDPLAVKVLNKALIKYFYKVDNWDIPANYLCPAVPGRADYIHNIADLLSVSNKGKIPIGKRVHILDIGVGANCIYPIIGNSEYGWQFLGADIDKNAIKSAEQIISSNFNLKENVTCRLQPSSFNIFKGILNADDKFDAVICNPPFHSSAEEAKLKNERKVRNLGIQKNDKPSLNFGGSNSELWCKGGEAAFIEKMINESAEFSHNCFWYSTLISQKQNLKSAYWLLEKVKPTFIKSVEMSQGNKVSRIIAWTFFDKDQQESWRERWSLG